MKKIFKTINFLFILFLFSGIYKNALAFNPSSEIYINQAYDNTNRSSLNVTQIKATNSAIFYADKDWWSSLSSLDQTVLQSKIYLISSEIEYKIKPVLNNTFGQEPAPLNGNDSRLSIILTPMVEGVQGYIRTSDFVLKTNNTLSNEGNVIYLNGNKLKTVSENIAYSFIAHEFMHLISYNQKYINKKVNEDTWLEELRAEYAPTIVGYNNNWDSSYLKIRAIDFIKNNIISFVDWDNSNPNYSSVNLFANYLVEQYGQEIILESFRSSKVGIASINEFLNKRGDNFDQVFQDWLITNILNDCNVSSKYCYKNPNLKNLTISPSSFYLPMNGNSALAISDTFVPYMAKYQKISGGSADLNFDFENASDNIVKRIPYVIVNKDGTKKLFFFEFQNNKSQKIIIPDFNKEAVNLIIIPYNIRNDNNFSVRSIFKWSATITNAGTGTPVNVNPSNPTTPTTTKPTTDFSSIIERQSLLISLQGKLIILMQQLISLLLSR